MRLRDILGPAALELELDEGEAVGPTPPLTPAQARKRSERVSRTQQRMADERARSAAKLRDLRADLP